MSNLQQTNACSLADSTDLPFTNTKETLNETSNIVKTRQIIVTYGPNNPEI